MYLACRDFLVSISQTNVSHDAANTDCKVEREREKTVPKSQWYENKVRNQRDQGSQKE